MAEVSVIGAADKAVQETGRQLLPFRFERWFVLGFVAWLENCGRGGGGGCNGPGGGGGGGQDFDLNGKIQEGLSYLGEHVLVVVGIVAAALTVILLIAAACAFFRSRATFIYIDNVASGRADVGRPWREHSARASSYFAWSFGSGIVCLMLLMLAAVPLGWAVIRLAGHGAAAGPITAALVSGLFMLGALFALGLLDVALRNFVAPLQWSTGLSCGGALRVFGGLLKAHPGAFAVFVVLKIVLGVGLAMIAVTVGCLTCCCGFLPVVHETLLQPVLYFDRRWSLELLAQLGHPMPAPVPPAGLEAPPAV